MGGNGIRVNVKYNLIPGWFQGGRSWWLILPAGLGILLVYLASGPGIGQSDKNQPIQFNHQVHVKKEPCKTCHKFYETRVVAGRPDLFICMECHTNAVTEKEEEKILRQMSKSGQPLRWKRITRLPDHVRFSHRRHLVAGKVECQTCHGPIAQTTSPPEEPLVIINMNFCLDCHRAETVVLDREAFKQIKEQDVGNETLSALLPLQNKRFASKEDFLASLERILVPQSAPQGVSGGMSTAKRIILDNLHQAESVTVDCIACHL